MVESERWGMKSDAKLSYPMLRVLRHLAAGLSACYHCKTQSDYGGLEGTMRALAKRGLMTWEYKITEAGREVVKEDHK